MAEIDFMKLDLMDALDLAVLIEEEAKERYEVFAEQVGTRYAGDAGDLFLTMVKNEAKHGAQLAERRKKLFGDKPCRVNRDMIWDIEAPDPGKPRTFMSAYQAMEVALTGEIKAFEFFCEALKYITNVQVKELFEELRDEEVEHKNTLKLWMEQHKGDKGADRDDDDIDDPPGL